MRRPGSFLVLLLLSHILVAQPSGPVRHVLLVHSWHQGFAWTDSQNQGMIQALTDKLDRSTLDFHVFYLDNRRLPAQADLVWQQFHALYDDLKVDLILSTDNPAFDLLKADPWRIKNNIPLVFAGVNNFQAASIKDLPQITGVAENFTSGRADTINLVLRLHPQTKTLVFLMDTSATSKAIQAEIEALKPRFPGLAFDFVTQDFLDSQLAAVAKLQAGSILIPVGIHKDAQGNLVSYEDAMEDISAACPVPSYGFIENRLGHGMVGGKILTGVDHGYQAGSMAAEILKGRQIPTLPVILENPGTYYFDARQLARFGIAESALPPDARILFRSPDPWTLYKGYIITYGLILLGVSILCMLLVISRQRLKQTRRDLAVNQSLLASYFSNSPESILVLDSSGHILQCNQSAAGLCGKTEADLLKSSFTDLVEPGSRPDAVTHLESLVHAGTHRQEFLWKNPEGSKTRVMMHSAQIGSNTYLCIGHDITQAREAEAIIHRSLHEKETLLKELYHRTKNNLNIVYSLLLLHADQADTIAIRMPFEEMALRIQAMALVHEKLYRSKDLSRINVRNYIQDLIARIALGMEANPLTTHVEEEVQDLELSLDTVMPLGLILNELLTNALKHARSTDGRYRLRVCLTGDTERMTLTVRDSGPGLPPGFQRSTGFRMGLQTVQTLVEDQLGGSLDFSSGPGLVVTVCFALPPPGTPPV